MSRQRNRIRGSLQSGSGAQQRSNRNYSSGAAQFIEAPRLRVSRKVLWRDGENTDWQHFLNAMSEENCEFGLGRNIGQLGLTYFGDTEMKTMVNRRYSGKMNKHQISNEIGRLRGRIGEWLSENIVLADEFGAPNGMWQAGEFSVRPNLSAKYGRKVIAAEIQDADIFLQEHEAIETYLRKDEGLPTQMLSQNFSPHISLFAKSTLYLNKQVQLITPPIPGHIDLSALRIE